MIRDLKPENFLYCTDDEMSPLKIIDFGLSKVFGSEDSFDIKKTVENEMHADGKKLKHHRKRKKGEKEKGNRMGTRAGTVKYKILTLFMYFSLIICLRK